MVIAGPLVGPDAEVVVIRRDWGENLEWSRFLQEGLFWQHRYNKTLVEHLLEFCAENSFGRDAG